MGRDSTNGVVGSPGSQPFLTPAQRAAMDAAIAAKQQGVIHPRRGVGIPIVGHGAPLGHGAPPSS